MAHDFVVQPTAAVYMLHSDRQAVIQKHKGHPPRGVVCLAKIRRQRWDQAYAERQRSERLESIRRTLQRSTRSGFARWPTSRSRTAFWPREPASVPRRRWKNRACRSAVSSENYGNCSWQVVVLEVLQDSCRLGGRCDLHHSQPRPFSIRSNLYVCGLGDA